MTDKKLTRRQEDVLGIVKAQGPVTVREVEYHMGWRLSNSSVRSILNALEAKSLIHAQYTGHSGRGRAYV